MKNTVISASPLPLLLALAQATTVDVIVTTRDQQPLAGLSASDFRVTENKQPRPLIAATALRPPSLEPILTRDPDLFTNRGLDTQGSSITILLDGLNTAPGILERARTELAQALERTEFTGRIGLLYFDGALFRIGPFSNRPAEQAALLRNFRRPPDSAARRRAIQVESGNTIQTTRDTRYAPYYRITGAALDTIAQGLAAVEGRKSLLWVASTFPFAVSANQGLIKQENEIHAIEQGLATAQRTNLAIYPVALQNLPSFNQTTVAAPSLTQRDEIRKQNSRSSMAYTQLVSMRRAQLETLRDATGGRVLDIDDMSAALETAVRDSRSVYRLVFEAPPAKSPELRSLDIELPGHRGAILLHRSATPYVYTPKTPDDLLQRAFETMATSPLEATAVSVQVRRQSGALQITAGPAGLLTDDARIAFDFAIALLDEKGTVVSWMANRFDASLSGPLKSGFARKGLQWDSPVGAGSRYRVIVRDRRTGLAGSVTVPGDLALPPF